MMMDASNITPFLTIKEACAVTGLSQFFLRRGVRDGSIPHVTVGIPPNCKYYINVPALLEQLGVPPQSRPGAGNTVPRG